jgi:hypothetical protein
MDESLNFIIPLIMIVAFLLLGGFAIILSQRSKTKSLDTGRALSEGLGLELVGGEAAFRRACEEAGQGEYLAKIERLPAPILRFLIANAPWRLEGERGGLRVAVYPESRSSGKSSVTYTVARAYYRLPLGYDLSVQREGAAFKLGKALFGIQDIELGDPELDPLIRVKAGDPLAAKLLLDRAEARGPLLALATRYRDFRATRDYAHWERRGLPADAAELAEVLDLLVPLARALGG